MGEEVEEEFLKEEGEKEEEEEEDVLILKIPSSTRYCSALSHSFENFLSLRMRLSLLSLWNRIEVIRIE